MGALLLSFLARRWKGAAILIGLGFAVAAVYTAGVRNERLRTELDQARAALAEMERQKRAADAALAWLSRQSQADAAELERLRAKLADFIARLEELPPDARCDLTDDDVDGLRGGKE